MYLDKFNLKLTFQSFNLPLSSRMVFSCSILHLCNREGDKSVSRCTRALPNHVTLHLSSTNGSMAELTSLPLPQAFFLLLDLPPFLQLIWLGPPPSS